MVSRTDSTAGATTSVRGQREGVMCRQVPRSVDSQYPSPMVSKR